MPYIRIYELSAKEGCEDDMWRAISSLARAVSGLHGCIGVEMVADEKVATSLRFIERWSDREQWEHSKALLPKDLLTPIMDAATAMPVTFAGEVKAADVWPGTRDEKPV